MDGEYLKTMVADDLGPPKPLTVQVAVQPPEGGKSAIWPSMSKNGTMVPPEGSCVPLNMEAVPARRTGL